MALALGKETTATGAAELGWAAYEKGDVETAAKHLGEAAKAADARPWVVYVARPVAVRAAALSDAASDSWERVRRRRAGLRADLLQPGRRLQPPPRRRDGA